MKVQGGLQLIIIVPYRFQKMFSGIQFSGGSVNNIVNFRITAH